jgi:hypothetical protein
MERLKAKFVRVEPLQTELDLRESIVPIQRAAE